MALNDNPWGQGRVYLNESDRPDWELAMKLTIIPAKFAGDNQESPITIGSGGDSDANESLSDSEDDEFDESDDYGPSVGQYGLGLDYLSTDVDLYAIGSDGFGTAAQGFGSDPDDENPAESSSKQNHELAAERFALDIEGQEDFLHSVLIEPKDDFAMGHTQQWLKEAGSQGLYEPARGLLHPRAFQVKYAPRVPGVGDGDGVYRAILMGLTFNGRAYVTRKLFPHNSYAVENKPLQCNCVSRDCNLCLANARLYLVTEKLAASQRLAKQIEQRQKPGWIDRLKQNIIKDLTQALLAAQAVNITAIGHELREKITQEIAKAQAETLRMLREEQGKKNRGLQQESQGMRSAGTTATNTSTLEPGSASTTQAPSGGGHRRDSRKQPAAKSVKTILPQEDYESDAGYQSPGGKSSSSKSSKRSLDNFLNDDLFYSSSEEDEAEEDNENKREMQIDLEDEYDFDSNDEGDASEPEDSEDEFKDSEERPHKTNFQAKRSRGPSQAKRHKTGAWTDEEKQHVNDIVITQIADQNAGLTKKLFDAHLWDFVSHQLKVRFDIDRAPGGCKMYWCREGREQSGLDERDTSRRRTDRLRTSLQ